MSDAKKPRAMTVKGFLSKASKQGVGSAAGFIKQHREWLTTGSLAAATLPILTKLDACEIYPTPALEMLSTVVLGHHYAAVQAEHEEAQVQAEEAPRGSSKKWVATIYNAAGQVQTRINPKGEEEDLTKGFDLEQDANRWVDRRLFDGCPDWFGTVVSTCMVDTKGDALSTVILRADAIARILKQPRGPMVRQPPKGGSRLSFGIKNAKTTRVEFSRG
jgi:hypothetical protein